MKLLLFFGVYDLYMLSLLDQGLSLTDVARKLHLTQPAISQRLSRLNYILGTYLHEKVGRGIQLTPAGKKLAVASRAAIKLLDLALPIQAEGSADRPN